MSRTHHTVVVEIPNAEPPDKPRTGHERIDELIQSIDAHVQLTPLRCLTHQFYRSAQ